MNPKMRIVISSIVLIYGICFLYSKMGIDISVEGLALDIFCSIIAYGLILVMPVCFLLAWIFSGQETLKAHNTLYHCKNCDTIYREYQGKCQECKSKGWSIKLEEIYDWMKHGPGFEEHSWKQYKQFLKLGEILEREEYEQRSHEMFLKYLNKYNRK